MTKVEGGMVEYANIEVIFSIGHVKMTSVIISKEYYTYNIANDSMIYRCRQRFNV